MIKIVTIFTCIERRPCISFAIVCPLKMMAEYEDVLLQLGEIFVWFWRHSISLKYSKKTNCGHLIFLLCGRQVTKLEAMTTLWIANVYQENTRYN